MTRGVRRRPADSISIKLGNWFEAHATGWGVLAVAILTAAVLAGLLISTAPP